MAYPEKIPSNINFDKFKFSFSQASKQKDDLKYALEKLETRINNITSAEKFYVADLPILKHIVGLEPTKNELKKMSKALDRLADLVEAQRNLKQKLQVHDVIDGDRDWFIQTFGDFEVQDDDIEEFLNESME